MKKGGIIIAVLLVLYIIGTLISSNDNKDETGNKANTNTKESTEIATDISKNTEGSVNIEDLSESDDLTKASENDADSSVDNNTNNTTAITIGDIPEYADSPYVEINNNIPYFTEDEKLSTEVFEEYSSLDSLGRCGVAYANLCKELLPTEERGEIGDVRPSGWHTVKYNDLIEGNYLYNRCHLIAYRLAGENDNKKNLITGTRYLNTMGMLPFENEVGDYIESSKNHVLYRVTPIFEGDNLVASGVEIEAWSVEDAGHDICFNVYCYNVQPGISIDYATGESSIDESIAKDIEIDTESCDYVANTNTRKIHLPSCSSVSDMAERNRWYYSGSIEYLEELGYKPCQRCLKGK